MENSVDKQKRSAVVETLIDMLASGEYETGDRFPSERRLSQELGISRTTLREGMSALEVTGLLHMRVGGGSYVTDFDVRPFIRLISRLYVRDDAMVDDLLELRKLFEIEAVRLSIRQQNKQIVKKTLGPIMETMEKCMFGGDSERGAQADIGFHKALYTLSANRILSMAGDVIGVVLESSVRYNREHILRDADNMDELYNQHNRIYRAILHSEETVAVHTITKHLDFVRQMI